jgi:hypothetical protein
MSDQNDLNKTEGTNETVPGAPVETSTQGQPEGKPAGSPPIDLNKQEPAEEIKTGAAALDVSLKFLAQAGLKPSDPLVKGALESGDFGPVKAWLTAKDVKGFEPFLALAEEHVEAKAAAEKAAREATAKLVYEVAGGEEQWGKVRAWAADKADESERDAINAMMKAGGLQAKIAAKYLVSAYEAAHGKAPEAKPAALPATAARGPAAPTTALDPASFRAELASLTARIGTNALARSPEYKALLQRRAAFRG